MNQTATNKPSYLKIAALGVVVFLVLGAIDKKNPDQTKLYKIADVLETASANNDKKSPSLLFDQLTSLKYKYADEKNIPCLKAVMALTGSADEVNETGKWTGKTETMSAIKQCEG